jgi:hypothetical protein
MPTPWSRAHHHRPNPIPPAFSVAKRVEERGSGLTVFLSYSHTHTYTGGGEQGQREREREREREENKDFVGGSKNVRRGIGCSKRT